MNLAEDSYPMDLAEDGLAGAGMTTICAACGKFVAANVPRDFRSERECRCTPETRAASEPKANKLLEE